jgi:hypothetical protein
VALLVLLGQGDGLSAAPPESRGKSAFELMMRWWSTEMDQPDPTVTDVSDVKA